MSDEERRSGNRRLQAVFAALVGISAGLVSLQAEPTVFEFVGAVLGGTVIGAVLIVYLYRSS